MDWLSNTEKNALKFRLKSG